ncbi:hypothetical protein SVIOM342S_00828 [Streptomyces violaceorubidus]
MSYTVCRGFSEPLGSWRTSWALLRYALSARAEYARGAPSKVTRPPVGLTRPSSERASVVLPQPDSPTSATISPGRMSRSTPSTARASAAPRLPGKVTCSPWTLSNGGV